MRSDFPELEVEADCITPFSKESLAWLAALGSTGSPTDHAWPATNTAIFIPFRLRDRTRITQIVIGGGATAGGNFDVGIYDRYGNRLVSSGSTARTTSAENVVNITDQVLGRGLYYMAMAADSTNNYTSITPAAVARLKLAGVREMTSAFTLPSTATYATVSAAFLPSIALWRSSL